jgi:hypothetical protein
MKVVGWGTSARRRAEKTPVSDCEMFRARLPRGATVTRVVTGLSINDGCGTLAPS